MSSYTNSSNGHFLLDDKPGHLQLLAGEEITLGNPALSYHRHWIIFITTSLEYY